MGHLTRWSALLPGCSSRLLPAFLAPFSPTLSAAFLAAVAAIAAAGLIAQPAQAQGAPAAAAPPVRTPSIVPQASDLAPPLVAPDNSAQVPRPTPPRELGKPESDVRVDVVRYAVDNTAPAELRAVLPQLTARYVGTQRRFEDLVNAAAEVTRFLQRDLGYYLGYAYLPEQAPADGVIRIAVLEGRLDSITLNWRDDIPVKREIVEAYLAHLKPGSVLKVRDVERVVFLVNDLRGLNARFEVRAGSTPGTASLVVTPTADNRWSGKAEFDVNGTQALGRYRLGGLVQMNSPFGNGDGLTANALASTTGGLAFALLGYTTPIGSDGIKLGASLSAVRYQLDKDTFALNLNGQAATINVYGLYPVVRSRNLNLFTLLSLENKQYEDRQEEVGGRTRKAVDALALGATGDFRDSVLGGGVNTYEASLISGRLKYPDGRSMALDDDASFTKFTYGFTRLQDLVTNRALLYTSIRGQYTRSNLDTTEQFRLGGPEGVRAFAAGEGTGDIGTIASLELRLLPPESLLGRVAREMVFAVFVDGGYVQYRSRARATVDINAGPNQAVYSGFGFGLSWVRTDGYTLRFSVAKPIDGTSRSDNKGRSARLFLQASKLFN